MGIYMGRGTLKFKPGGRRLSGGEGKEEVVKEDTRLVGVNINKKRWDGHGQKQKK